MHVSSAYFSLGLHTYPGFGRFRALCSPWVSWIPPKNEVLSTSIFLGAVQDALATKHLAYISQPDILPQAQLDAQSGLFRTIINGTPDIDDLRALHLLSLYPGTASTLSLGFSVGPGAPGRSGELFMANALRLAGQMDLEKDIQAVVEFRRSTCPTYLHTAAPQNVVDSLTKCRLVCLLIFLTMSTTLF